MFIEHFYCSTNQIMIFIIKQIMEVFDKQHLLKLFTITLSIQLILTILVAQFSAENISYFKTF